MALDRWSRRRVLQVVVGLGATSGCLGSSGEHRPGAVEVRNEDDRPHTATVTLYRFDSGVWAERGATPVLLDPDVPDDEPADVRDVTVDVDPGDRETERGAITEPFCGAAIIAEARLATGARTTLRLLSDCRNSGPDDVSDVHLIVDIDDDGAPNLTSLADEPGAA